MSVPIIGAVLDLGGKLIDRLLPDPAARDAARLKLLDLAQAGDLQALASQTQIVVAEAQSQSWLTRSWRPMVMLTFTALVVAHWLGWTAPGISEAQVQSLLDIVQLGLGGYVIGRSAEKVAETLAPALGRGK